MRRQTCTDPGGQSFGGSGSAGFPGVQVFGDGGGGGGFSRHDRQIPSKDSSGVQKYISETEVPQSRSFAPLTP